MQLTSDTTQGNGNGKAAAIIEGKTINYEIRGNYNGASLGLMFLPIYEGDPAEQRSDWDDYQFEFAGNCIGNNVIKGPRKPGKLN